MRSLSEARHQGHPVAAVSMTLRRERSAKLVLPLVWAACAQPLDRTLMRAFADLLPLAGQ